MHGRHATNEERITALLSAQVQSCGLMAELPYQQHYLVLVSEQNMTGVATVIARNILGDASVDGECRLVMGSEDTAYMLAPVPGCLCLF